MTEELTLEELAQKQERIRKERRYRILPVDIEDVLNLLYPPGEFLKVSNINLPEDVHPVTVHYSYDRQQFLFLLESENFSPVKPGMEIPYIDSFGDIMVSRQTVLRENR